MSSVFMSTTPPGNSPPCVASTSELPPTPDSTRHVKRVPSKVVAAILRLAIKRPYSPDIRPTFKVSSEQYAEFLRELKKPPRLWDKQRYDYDSEAGELALRMPHPVHELVAMMVESAIFQKVKALGLSEHDGSVTSARLRTLVEPINLKASTFVKLDIERGDKKSPDRSFGYGYRPYPPFVIEVANSQEGYFLPHQAETYIRKSKGRVKTILAINLEYWDPAKRASKPVTPRRACYNVYRYTTGVNEGGAYATTTCFTPDVAFSPTSGPTEQPSSLELLLSDFMPRGVLAPKDPNPTIPITHDELRNYLEEADRHQELYDTVDEDLSDEESRAFPTQWVRGERAKEEASRHNIDPNSDSSFVDEESVSDEALD